MVISSHSWSPIALLERLHFRREGHLIQSYLNRDHWVDEYLYVTLDVEWLERPTTRQRADPRR